MSTAARILALAMAASFAIGADKAAPPAVVSHVLVLSEHIEDVSSLEAWAAQNITPGMSDEEKAKKVWETVVKFRHQSTPPNEYLMQDSSHPHDFVKMANSYGWGQCCCASAHITELARHVGLQARGWAGNNHSIPEIFFDGKWHMMDASLINWYLLDDKKTIASIEDLSANPEARVNQGTSPFVDTSGWYPARTHQVKDSPGTYVKKGNAPHVFEYGYSSGYELNVQLRDGERLTRNWSNKGLHVNKREGGEQWNLEQKVGEGDLCYAPQYGDIAPGRVGNGATTYAPPLGRKAFLAAALAAENVATTEHDKKKPAVHVQDAGKPASFTVRMPSSYVYLGGSLAFDAVVGAGGSLKVSFSQNNGLDWSEIANVTASGAQTIDLTDRCYRRYDYRLRFDLAGAGTGLDALTIAHDIQHSQRPLPALKQGKNAITFRSARQEGRITIEGNIDPGVKDKQLLFTDFHPVVENLAGAPLFMQAGTGSITYPVETPGDMTRIVMGCFYRARGTGEGFDFQASFDDGKTWKDFGRAEGPIAGNTAYHTLTEIPKGTRTALLRFAGKQNNTLGFFHHSINAHYVEPRGGFRPVKITYRWTEGGVEKEDVHIAKKAEEAYTITCAGAPTMTSFTVELAP
ncbi:MAG TPA: hypothetical protein VEL07_15665 [Planctomycetota bacterium]|nr:hypothetical protein [Planctomycetota bacterium]